MSEMIEQWKDIKGYEGLYQISNLGRVRSLNYNRTGKVKVLKNSPAKHGYLKISLWHNGKKKTFTIHRLVAEAFIPNPDNLPCVNHKDEDKTNNCVGNLEFCTPEYNNNYGTHNERVSKKLMISVSQYDKTGILIKVYSSAKDAQMDTGIFRTHITKCCKGKLKTTGGYMWRYTN